MAELCRKCFIETWHPNAYDRHHILMSEENEFCEGCMDCVPYVSSIDPSEFYRTSTVDDFANVIVAAAKAGRKVACVECGIDFEDDDLAFVYETGECPYCHNSIEALWVKL